MQIFIMAAIGIVTGFANGLFGAGGGLIVVMAMERYLKIDAHRAHSTSIAIILPLSVLSAFIYCKKEMIDFNILFYISIGGLIGGFIGAKLLHKVQSKWLHRILGFFMIIASLRMIL